MSQASGRPCPACGTPVPAGQRFCSNCGTDLSVSGPARQSGGSSPQQMPPYGQPQQQVPPYAQTPGSYGQQQPVQPYQQPQPQRSNPIAEALGALGLLFFMRRYRPGYRPRRQSSGCCGCLVALVILLLIFGIPGYVYYHAHPNVINQIKNQVQQSNSGTGNNVNNGNGSTPTTQPPITTANINQTVTYSGVQITLESVQQSAAFPDDTSTGTTGALRIKIKETNNSGQNGNYFYSDVAHLVLPDKSTVALSNALQAIAPDTATTRENWLDFAVPTSDKIDQITLVLGSTQYAQMSIPLTSNANLNTLQAKTVNLNKPISYDSLNWTLVSATESFSIAGHQATSGMRYVVLSFKVDNPTSSNKVIGFPNEYMRLKAGSIVNSPADGISTTLPLGANANTTGTTGTVTFLMPQGNTAYTLIFLANPNYSNVQVNMDFTIQ
ncbi:MAG TPA: zinc ribbon domain-containing protein [Ktedonobacteraceae bacterium]